MPVQRTKVHRVNRRRRDPSSGPGYTLATATNTIASTKWRLVSTVPLVVSGIPQTFKCAATSGGAVTQIATAVSVVNPTTIDMTFATGPVSGSGYTIGMNDPAIRTNTGGYVAAATGTF
jgi:hypothetical protein